MDHKKEEKHRRYLPGILLESILIFLVNGVGTFALLHTLVPSVNGIPFKSAPEKTARQIPEAALNEKTAAQKCSWEKSRDLPYHLPDKGIWECK